MKIRITRESIGISPKTGLRQPLKIGDNHGQLFYIICLAITESSSVDEEGDAKNEFKRCGSCIEIWMFRAKNVPVEFEWGD